MQSKLLSDKQMKFKEYSACLEINFIKICPEIALKYFFLKMWFYMKYIVTNRRWRIFMSMDCTWFLKTTSSHKYEERRIEVYMINRLWYGIFHFTCHISPRPIFALVLFKDLNCFILCQQLHIKGNIFNNWNVVVLLLRSQFACQ